MPQKANAGEGGPNDMVLVQFRVPRRLKRAALAKAKRDGMQWTEWLRHVLREAVEREK